jgi:hypothetical protein
MTDVTPGDDAIVSAAGQLAEAGAARDGVRAGIEAIDGRRREIGSRRIASAAIGATTMAKRRPSPMPTPRPWSGGSSSTWTGSRARGPGPSLRCTPCAIAWAADAWAGRRRGT